MAISPDGAQVAYATDSVSERFEGLTDVEIYVADTTKPGPNNAARQLTKNEALEGNVRWSPDGKSVFFEVEQGSVEGSYADLQFRVYSVDVATAKPTRWAATFDGSVTGYALRVQRWLCSLPECSAPRQPSISKPRRKTPSASSTDGPAPTRTSPPRQPPRASRSPTPKSTSPPRFTSPTAPTQLSTARPITSFNKLFTERDLPKGKPFRWTSDDGTSVEGYLLYPPGKFEAKNLRLFVLIHGGPMDADGNYFGADWYNWAHVRRQPGMAGLSPQLSRLRRLWRQVRDRHRAQDRLRRPAATSSPASKRS